MSKATNAFSVITKNLSLEDIVELIDLLSGYLEEQSQQMMEEKS
jgi:hypothetical protein